MSESFRYVRGFSRKMFGFKSLNEKKKRFHALEISATSAISVTVNLFQQYLPISTTIYIKGIVIIIRIS